MTKRLTVLVGMLAVLLAAAVPAMAQEDVIQAPIQTFVSGNDTNTGGAVETKGGNSSNACAPQQEFNNSGGLLNQQSQQQSESTSGEAGVGFGGSAFTNTPGQAAPCEQTVQQAAAASSSTPPAATPPPPAPEKTTPPAPKAETTEQQATTPQMVPTPAPKAEVTNSGTGAQAAKAEQQQAKTEKQQAKTQSALKPLPETGGATIPVLGIVGVLLVGGGLLIRRLAR